MPGPAPGSVWLRENPGARAGTGAATACPMQPRSLGSLRDVSTFDLQVTPRVRARAWAHRGGPTAFRPGAHHVVEIGWVFSGEIAHRIGRRRVEAHAGAAAVVPAFVEHATSFAPGAHAGSVWLDLDFVTEVASEFGARVCPDPEVLPEASHVAALGDVLVSEAAREGHGRVLAVDAIAEALVLAWLRVRPSDTSERGGGQTTRDPRIARALELVESQYHTALTVDDLARAAGMSRFHFSRVFRDELGTSPYKQLLDTRLDRARELLLSGTSVTETAFTVGCPDLGRFARAFRKRFGTPPSAYAASLRKSA